MKTNKYYEVLKQKQEQKKILNNDMIKQLT